MKMKKIGLTRVVHVPQAHRPTTGDRSKFQMLFIVSSFETFHIHSITGLRVDFELLLTPTYIAFDPLFIVKYDI